MRFPLSEEPTRTQTTPLANKSPKAKPAPPPQRETRVRPKPDSPTTRTKARVRRGPKAVSPRSGSKTAKILALLRRPDGAGLKELLKATGWQPHSVRGFLSGTVAKKMGLKVSSNRGESGERRYAVKA
jgi:Protein of unknown function (DUF3489)